MAAPAPPRVLDTTSGIAGAYAALLLHQAGADVVRRAPTGDDPQLSDGSALAGYLRQGQGRVAATDDRLTSALGADVLVATPVPADRDALLAIRAAEPGVVVVAITPYGLEGPSCDRPASDLTLQADSGALAIRGNAGEEPIQMGGRTIQWLAGAYAAAAAMALWRGRRAGGPGALVDVSLAEVANTGAANFMDVFLAVEFGVDGEPVTPPRVFETPSIERSADGWVGFNTNAPHQVTAFLRMMGRDDLADRGEWMMAASRIERADEWQAMVTEWTSARTTDEIVAAAVAHHVPVAPVADGRSVAELDHVVARCSLAPQPGSRAVVPRRPWRFDGELPPDPDPVPDPTDVAPADLPDWAERDQEPPPAAALGPVRPRPLEGLRVLDLTTWWAGPAATGLLAALGADVVHIEGPDRMDGVRMVGMMFADRPQWWERSPFFLAVDVDKRDLVVDLLSARGRTLMLDLVRQVDVVVENATPHVLDKLDLGWDVIHGVNPAAVLVRMPAFGLDGPWRERPGFAQNIEQASGLAWLTGQPDDQPRIQRGPCDPNGGAHAAIALLEALDRRDETGLGTLVEVALFDAALALASEAIVAWSADGVLLQRDGNRSPFAAPQGVYRAAGDDAWLALSVETDEQWQALATVIGRNDLATEPTLADQSGRRSEHDLLDSALAEWTATRQLDSAVELLVGAGVPAAPARDPRLTYRHPQFRARGYQQVVDHPVIGPLPVPTLPFRVDGIDHWVRRPAPTFGQHNDEVLTELLGLSPADLASLRAQGIIADRPTNV